MWEENVRCRSHAQTVYNTAYTEYNNSIYESLTSASQPHKWWSTLKNFLFGVNISHSLIHTQDSSVTFDPFEIAEVFTMVFHRKPCDQVLNLPYVSYVFLILWKKKTKLLLLFHKKPTKLVFLWSHVGQKKC